MDQSVCIVGMGYVGLTLAVVMAEQGFRVTGVENNGDILRALRSGKPHFHEVGLAVRLKQVLTSGALGIREDLGPDVESATVFIISVGTPLGPNNEPRIDMVERVAREVAKVMPENALVVLRSTVVVGTSRKIVLPALQSSNKPFHLAYCPERTIEGKALEELRTLPQIVGGYGQQDTLRAALVFQELTPTTVRVSSLETAELVKLLDNSYRDLFFAFGNEVGLLSNALAIDGVEVINAANTGYPRTNIACPGFVGGPCLEKDPHILQYSLAPLGFVPKLISAGRQLNEELPHRIVESILHDLPKAKLPERPIVSVCGLAFKGRPETDDLRGTPARLLIRELKKACPAAIVQGQDFAVPPEGIASLGLRPVTIEQAFQDASLVIMANNNTKYQWLDYPSLFACMSRPGLVYDTWDVLNGAAPRSSSSVIVRRFGSENAWRNADAE